MGFMAVIGRMEVEQSIPWVLHCWPELLGELHGHVDEGEESIVGYPGAIGHFASGINHGATTWHATATDRAFWNR